MNTQIDTFDIIIVYSGMKAKSAGNTSYTDSPPFPPKSKVGVYNDCYRYFLERCKKKGLNAAFATSSDICGSGLFKSFWTYDNTWHRHPHKAYTTMLFDKFTPKTSIQKEQMSTLTSSKKIYTFNKEILTKLFENKFNTYKHFKEYTIPTVEITQGTEKAIMAAKKRLDAILQTHPYHEDFLSGYIIKNKTGSGGFNIHKVTFTKKGIAKIINYHTKHISYVLQPFLTCDTSFHFKKHRGTIDVRVITLNTKTLQSYIRVAQKGNFLANQHQGGSSFYISLRRIPQDVIIMNTKIKKILENTLDLSHSLYALDYIRSNNGHLYLVEGNTNPGIYWEYDEIRSSKRKIKKLINTIVHEIKTLIQERKNTQ